MRQLSIKTRITIWYTAFLVVVVAAVLGVLFSVGSYQTKASVTDRLTGMVDDALSEIEYDEGRLEVDDDLDFVDGGVYLAVYSADGTLLAGQTPRTFTDPPPLALSTGPYTLSREGTTWSVYDTVKKMEQGKVWVRGVASLSDAESPFGTMLRLALITLPFLVLLAAAGGYGITRRAFAPVKRIAQTAERIGEGADLSARIDLPPGTDEIHTLANVFDRMFARLEAAFHKERQFTADASHELRTPTAVIIAQSEYALAHPADAPQALNAILEQAKKMSRLLSQLLLLARADQGAQKLSLDTLDLSELMEMVCLEQEEHAREKGVTLHTDLEPDLLFRGDELLLVRMLVNLLQNAIRYDRPGGNVWVRLRREENTLVGSVRDDGPGIPPEAQPRVWERFYQLDPSRSGEGAGLGLSMVKWIAEAHGGRVALESEPEKGSCFSFYFPT